jgi:hypothetical protein
VEHCGVICCPVTKRARWLSGDLLDRRRNKRRLTGCGTPCVEQHVHAGSRNDREQLTPGLFWRNLFDAQGAANYATDCSHLFRLAQGFRPRQNIFRFVVPIVTQRADRDSTIFKQAKAEYAKLQ